MYAVYKAVAGHSNSCSAKAHHGKIQAEQSLLGFVITTVEYDLALRDYDSGANDRFDDGLHRHVTYDLLIDNNTYIMTGDVITSNNNKKVTCDMLIGIEDENGNIDYDIAIGGYVDLLYSQIVAQLGSCILSDFMN